MSSRRLLTSAALFSLLSGSSVLADEPPPAGAPAALVSAAPAKLAPDAGMTLPAELLTLPAASLPPRVQRPVRGQIGSPEPDPGGSDVRPMRSGTTVQLDSDRGHRWFQALSDGDRDTALLVRVRVPF